MNNPSQSNTITDELLRTHPNFEANLLSLYMTPTTDKFDSRQIDTLTTMLHMPPKIFQSGKINVIVSSNSNSTFPNLHIMILTLKPTISPLLLPSKSFTTKPINLFLNKNTPKISYSKITNSPPHSLPFSVSLNHLYIFGTICNYGPVKQCYIFSPYHEPTRPLFVPREALNLKDDSFTYTDTY